MIPLTHNDHELLRRVREHFRLGVTFGSPTQLDAILELLCEREAKDDPEWKRPEVMGKRPSAKVIEAMGASATDESEGH